MKPEDSPLRFPTRSTDQKDQQKSPTYGLPIHNFRNADRVASVSLNKTPLKPYIAPSSGQTNRSLAASDNSSDNHQSVIDRARSVFESSASKSSNGSKNFRSAQSGSSTEITLQNIKLRRSPSPPRSRNSLKGLIGSSSEVLDSSSIVSENNSISGFSTKYRSDRAYGMTSNHHSANGSSEGSVHGSFKLTAKQKNPTTESTRIVQPSTASRVFPKTIRSTERLTHASKNVSDDMKSISSTHDFQYIWVRHNLIEQVLVPKPSYGASLSTISTPGDRSATPSRVSKGYARSTSSPLPGLRSLNSTPLKLRASNNDDLNSEISSSNHSGQLTVSARWGWVKAMMLNHTSNYIKEKDKKIENNSTTFASKGKQKSTSDTIDSTASNLSSVSSEPDHVRVQIIDLESEYLGKTVDIPKSLLLNRNRAEDSIFGDSIVVANAWPDFVSIPVHSDKVKTSSVETTPVSKWSTTPYKSSPNVRRDTSEKHAVDDDKKVPSNLIHLTHLHEPAVVFCIRHRYAINQIYTSTGPILLALNPFKDIKGIYGDDIMRKYCEKGQTIFDGSFSKKKFDSDLSPHVYGVADDAYRAMMRGLEEWQTLGNTADQSILVSGESGAGKTVTTKIIMKYLATLSKRSLKEKDNIKKKKNDNSLNGWNGFSHNFIVSVEDTTQNASPSQAGINTEQKVLESNPILESFGNARTIRNDNSSRFGKFIEIQFSDSGKLLGAFIDSYLLEKVRLIKQSNGERNYHIFYELLSGASINEKKDLLLSTRSNPEDFAMTTSASSTYTRRDGVKDDSTFISLKKAMLTMGFSSVDQMNIFRLVSALLHLSNVTLEENSSGCSLDIQNSSLPAALQLLGVTADSLEKALCCVNMNAGGERVVKRLFLDQSIKAKEALIKSTYGMLFAYLVTRINQSINGDHHHTSYDSNLNSKTEIKSTAAFIGVLDIFGFESFDHNSFEQLCINYCNESLQQQFNRFVFKLEQEEYEREGIRWDFISFPDNQNVLDLIDKKRNGLISILDEQSFLTQCTDQSFAQLLYQKCGGGRATSGNPFSASSRQMAVCAFSIHHYAGPVEYDATGFLEKNKDELPKEIDEMLLSSNNDFLRHLASTMRTFESEDDFTISKTPSKSNNSLKRITVGAQFSSQLQLLRKRIDATTPHYIRCLKPNDKLEPDNFDSAVIADQLRCAGILEAVRVSRVGFSQRYLHEHFVYRYQCLSLKELQMRRKEARNSYSVPSGFGFNGGYVVPNTDRKSFVAKKSLTSTEKKLHPEEECKILINSLVKYLNASKNTDFDSDIENVPFQDGIGTQKHGKWGTLAISNQLHAPVLSKKQHDTDLLELGLQMGKTKVFLRQPTFEALERMRGRVKSVNATIINSVCRMHLTRKRYIKMRDEYRARVAQRSRIIQEGGFVSDLPSLDLSFDDYSSQYRSLSLHKEDDGQFSSSKNFKWVVVDNRWKRNETYGT